MEILEPYGGPENLKVAFKDLDSMTETEVLAKYPGLFDKSQEHCLKELQAAEPCLSKHSIILIDDNTLPGGGKGRLARQYLLDKGWVIVFDYHQSLWIRY